MIGLGISRMDYELSGVFRSLSASGTADTFSFFGTTPLWRTARNSLSLSYGWDYRKLTDAYKAVGIELEKHSSTFHFGLKGEDRYGRTALTYDITAYAGRLTPDSDWARLQTRRADTEGSFTKGVLNLNLRHEISDRWSLNLKAQAQKAGSNLDSSEELYLGGANGVRAYPQGEASGDNGILGSLELSYRTGVPNLTVSTYLDMGHIKYANGGRDGNETLKGWGLGATYSRPGDYFLRLDWARRIGLPKDASDAAQARNRLWCIVGKVW